MAKNSSNKSRYPSRYSPGGWVSAPQYVTELICESKARQDKKDLPRKFWEDKDWEKYFKYQIILANSLIKDFGEEAVIAALRDRRCWYTYSLRSPFLIRIIKEKKDQSVDTPKDTEYNIKESDEVRHKTNNTQKSIISRLRDLDE